MQVSMDEKRLVPLRRGCQLLTIVQRIRRGLLMLGVIGVASCSPITPSVGCDPGVPQGESIDGTGAAQSGVLGPSMTWRSPVDGMVLVYVPAGEFLMGASALDADALDEEKPQHRVYLDSYWIDSTEVTNAMYAVCVSQGACTPPGEEASFSRREYYSHPACSGYPVVHITWQQAHDYCRWAGRRLPTEAEWEKAARGTDRRIYPGGNEEPDGSRANLCGSVCPNEANEPSIDDGFFDTSPVGAYPAGASPYGALDMAGNVWEWVADWGDARYYSVSPYSNPTGPETGHMRVLRGGAFTSPPPAIRVTVRAFLNATVSSGEFGGFRCAASSVP